MVGGNGVSHETRAVKFTEDELKAIHRELYRSGWCGEVFYDERRAVMRKLDRFFGQDVEHLKLQTR